MNVRQPERDEIQAWLDASIESYIDGDLPVVERDRFERARATGVGEEDVALARRIRDELRALPAPTLRPEVSHVVLARARVESWSGFKGWLDWLAEMLWSPALRPALSMAVLIAIVLGALLVRPPTRMNTGSQDDIEQALAEAKWALAYVSQVGKETGSSVRDDVLRPHVVGPVKDALNGVLEDRHKTTIR